ncbi:Lysine-specific demethylase 4D, partial [Frankliniella fusca]
FFVPPGWYDAFIWMLRNLAIPDDQKGLVCQLPHKDLWISPRTVVNCGIPVYTIVQRPGDIVYLLPNAIHWGFNVDFNVNEACNYVCPLWVLPGMLSHQRCCCHQKWAARFEIRDVLAAHGAEAKHLKLWSSGETLIIGRDLKASQPLLYTRLKDVYDRCLDEEAMSVGVIKAVPASWNLQDGADAPLFPKCTLCSYCPGRCRSDAYERIRALHSPLPVETKPGVLTLAEGLARAF